jgi:beta-N-acetylhexosaminidase
MQENSVIIQPYLPERDAERIYSLWQENLDLTWPIEYERMLAVLAANEPAHFVAYRDSELVGCVATGKSWNGEQKVGHLELLLVAPYWQRQGIGTRLYNTALHHFQQAGIHHVQFGVTSPRFWFAIPRNLPSALAFFEKQGWQPSTLLSDLVRSLKDFAVPEPIRQRMFQEEITLVPALPEHIADAIAFEEQEFSGWTRFFRDYSALGDTQDLLLARDGQQQIVGSLVMLSPQSHPQRPEFLWKKILGEDMGAIMAVGVAKKARGRGIGIALVAYAGELLRARGVDNCLIDWVVINDFYGKLGWRTWRDYYEGWLEL